MSPGNNPAPAADRPRGRSVDVLAHVSGTNYPAPAPDRAQGRAARQPTAPTLLALAALLAGALPAAAQSGPPRLECGQSVEYRLVWTAANVSPTPVVIPFEGVAGQTVSYQFNVRGPL